MLTVCIWILVCYLIIIFTTLISTLYVYIYIFIYICSVFWKESPLFLSTTFSPITFLVCCTRYTRILTRYSVTTPNPIASWVLVKYKFCSLFSEELFDRRNIWDYIFVNQTKYKYDKIFIYYLLKFICLSWYINVKSVHFKKRV